ncbi:hypothetical protein A9Z64_04450 [Moraxella osloensis]|uniref:Uncharacterized protein n=1 Tax=Faucicola osloensis TaxID=34062 RepID=A0A378QBD8_FAUOS|nr:hypothetical protein [Moraxella osloensis]AME01784.1 hypothetical protein AXE82_08450 [Moraxella osloensis]OBX57385.1 hypothetical protein A9Z64_04450 [Moraxella osloensis]QPT42478.1 hypothetical protein I6G27_00385 [Moraxella osloensis]STY98141.1 Uncharacterised protein [Moraxella osloensis]
MKLFSLKKNNDSIAPTSKDVNPSSQLAENPTTGVSDNALQLDTTQAPMQATNYPDTSPKTTAITNAFSLDTIDLNQLEDELLHGKTDYTADNTKAADTLAPKKLSFDDFDLDKLPSDVEPNTTVTIEDTANTATVSQPVPSQTTDNAPPQPIAPQSSNENSDESNDKKIIETIEAIETAPPVVLTKTKPESKAVIAKTSNPFLKMPSQPLTKRTLKKRNQLGLLVGAGLALAALAWFFMGQSSEPNKSTAQSQKQTQTQTQAHAIPKTTAPIVKPQASASLPAASTVAAEATTSSAHATTALPAITPEEILAPTLPEDPAIAKEELSRLSEQSAQLKEQETMMQDQLRMMNELSSKKEERIQLLEQQVAQLEQQKAANK